MSFYSKALYQDVGGNWKKISFLYLLLLLGVCLIPLVFRTQSVVSDYLSREAPKIVKQTPVITISKGKVSVPKDFGMPYIIRDPENNNPLIIIDTTGRTTSLSGTEAIALLTETNLIVRADPATRVLDLSGIESLTVDQSRIYDWIETFLDYLAIILYPIALFFSYIFRVLQALVSAVIGMFFARNLGVPLGFRALVSLSITSMTPAIILNTVHDYVGISIPFWWLINFLIALGYLFFAVKANAERRAT